MDDKLLPKLSQNLLEMLDDYDYYDVTIEVGKIFRDHMAISHYRSTYFRRILSTNEKKNDGTLVHINLLYVLPVLFPIIKFMLFILDIFIVENDF
jgi:hypothetical protein